MKLKGRTAIITGASQGLGKAIAMEFVRQGADVFICAREKESLLMVKEKLKHVAVKGQKVFAVVADVSKEAQVKRLINAAIVEFNHVGILVNNAGIYGPLGPIEEVKPGDWVKAVEINLFGVFYCCKHIIGHMKKNNYGKIINLSGGGATSPLPFVSAYAASKAGVVRFTETLAVECTGFKIDVNSMAPGALNTRLLDEVLSAGPKVVGKDFYEKAQRQKISGGVPLEVGVKLAVFLASSESDGISGRLISAKWDPWESLPNRRKELTKSDIYTLRRIVPGDRGKEWKSL
ncbi:MAG: SDR family NAD(P)-dependent oxidoreductase [Candidatus Omnitrophica bacterium]|nr:SDR family NAD(P)-dependent oxidoreductase [Candidatus Omnitrophota bacterium]